ncbi:MAG TPA: hypothetical protein VMV27_00930 [Candidatus Binataceae bacterium]|nr:hypothetical protein [Candidatus Binataceae bacterium]
MSDAIVERIARVLGRGAERQIKPGVWLTLCPAHNDSNPSLTIKVGSHVAAIWSCCGGTGCSNDDVGHALRDAGLWPPRDGRDNVIQFRPQQSAPKAEPDWVIVSPIPDDAPPFTKSPNAAAVWQYRDIAGRILGYVERVNREGTRKDFFPKVLERNRVTGAMRWAARAFPEPRPLYGLWRLPEKPDAPVLIVAGEKCADAGDRTVPTFATVSASGGEGAPAKTDWSPLNGRAVTIWADQDPTGRNFAAAVSDRLLKLDPNRTVKILDLGDDGKFPHKFDIADAEDGSKIKDGCPKWTAVQIQDFVKGHDNAPMKLGPIDIDGHDASKFTILGHDGNRFFFRRTINPQILEANCNTLGKNFLLSLAPLVYWESRYASKTGCDWTAAISDLIAIATAKGIFHEHQKRGRGAWLDRQKGEPGDYLLWHTGSKLIIGPKEVALADFKSRTRLVYDAKADLNLDLSKPLNDKEGARILDEVCCQLRWRKPISAYLFAGWMVLAPFGGALKWRSHVWISGAAGSGKTTLLNRIVKRLLADTQLYIEGPSTAAGIRGALDGDSLPVIFDEAERTGKSAEKRIEDILEIIMSASGGGGSIIKGTATQGATSKDVRACFCLASINTATRDTQAASRRITLLELNMASDPNQTAWESINRGIEQLPEGDRLIARTLKYFSALEHNIEIFKRAVAQHLGSQAMGDQLGPMLAGACLLKSTRFISEEKAREWVAGQEWDEHAPILGEDRDEERALGRLLSQVVRTVKPVGGVVEASVAQMVQLARGDMDDAEELRALADIGESQARQYLLRMGVRVVRGAEKVFIAHRNSELDKIYRDSAWARNWADSLARLPGAELGVPSKFASGRTQVAVALPWATVFPAGKEAVA